jgi:peptide chain release factor 2
VLRDRAERSLIGKDRLGSALVTLRAGAGGVDAEDWCRRLAGMYLKLCERRGWKAEVIYEREGREGGLRQLSIRIGSPVSYGLLASEHGTHRVAHHSRFGARGKRQTSFCAVEVVRELPRPRSMLAREHVDLTTFAGSSKGGQHANRSSTNVRLTHRPTGITAQATGRSQHRNLEAAWSVLAARVQAHAERAAEEVKGGPVDAGFGGRIRSYTFTPYRLVADDRVSWKSRRLDQVLDGELDELMWLLAAARRVAESPTR